MYRVSCIMYLISICKSVNLQVCKSVNLVSNLVAKHPHKTNPANLAITLLTYELPSRASLPRNLPRAAPRIVLTIYIL